MKLLLLGLLIALTVSVGVGSGQALAQEGIAVLSASAESKFPEGILFKIRVSSPNKITGITVRFAVMGQRAQRFAYIQFDPATLVSSEHLIRTDTQERYIPPGAKITYFYEIEDAGGNRLQTQSQTLDFLDSRFQWTEFRKGLVSVYYYGPVQNRAQSMAGIVEVTVRNMSIVLGVERTDEIRLVMYNNNLDMIGALPFTSSGTRESLITQGLTFGDENVVLILGGDEGYRGTASHEVTHVLVAQATRNAFVPIPAWLNEGLAEFGNLEPGVVYERFLTAAISTNTILPITSMSRPPGNPDDVILFYGESRSIVQLLIETYGFRKMTELMAALDAGFTIDQSLQRVYGFDRKELDRMWRDDIGAALFAGSTPVSPTAIPLPTIIPFGVTPIPPAVTPPPSAETPSTKEGGGGGFGCSVPASGGKSVVDLSAVLGLVAVAALVVRGFRRR